MLCEQGRAGTPDREAGMERDSSMMVRSDARSVGMVTAQTTRHTPAWGSMRTRAVGTADGQSQSVKVTYADGTSEVKPVSAFRKDRTSQRAKATKQAQHVAPMHVTQFAQSGHGQADYD